MTPSLGWVSTPLLSLILSFIFCPTSFWREWAAFLGAWCPLPASGSCFVEFAQHSNDLLMNLWGRKWSPCPICHLWSCYFFINQFKCCLLTAVESGDWPPQVSQHWPFPHPPSFTILSSQLWVKLQLFLGGAVGKVSACNAGDPGLIPGLGRSPGGGWQPTSVFLPGGFHGQRSLAGCCPWSQRVRHDWATNTFTLVKLIVSVYVTMTVNFAYC